MAGFACSKEPASPATEVWKLRNSGRLHAARDTPEGYAEAAAAFGRLTATGRDPADALNLARVSLLGGRVETAQVALEQFRARWPRESPLPVDVAYLEGLVHKALGQPARAAEHLREVTTREASSQPGWLQLGMVLSLSRDFAGAAQAFEKLLALNPLNLAAHYKCSMAYRALGDTRQADEALARFTELKKLAGDASLDEKANEKCLYTRVQLVPPPGATRPPPPVELTFAMVPAAAGLAGLEAVASVASWDQDSDGDADLYLLRRGPNQLLRNDAGSFVDATELADADDPGDGVHAAPADINNDGLMDLFVVNRSPASVLFKGLGEGVWQSLVGCGLGLEGVAAARWADYDHDGDLDLITLESLEAATPRLEARAHRNNGDETFTLIAGLFPGHFLGSTGSIALADLDQGNDIDFIVGSDQTAPCLFLNLRSGAFRRLDGPASPDTAGPLVGSWDLNGDGEFDLVMAGGPATELRVYLSRGARGSGQAPQWEAPRRLEIAAAVRSLQGCDLDNSGSLELVLGTARGVVVVEDDRIVTASGVAALPAGATTALDFDGDGRLDLLGVDAEGRLALAANSSRAHAVVTLRLTGGRDNRAGIGAHVELRAGPYYCRRLVDANGAQGAGPGVSFGLGQVPLEAIDGVEILWPNGIAQPLLPAELKWDEKLRLTVTQKRGLTVSCPFLFAHDGRSYRFVTDIVGIAPLDEWLPDGALPHLDPEEYVRIPADSFRAVAGRLRLAITEELKETTYLDRLRLWRVEHPVGTLCLGNETTRQGAMEPLRVWIVPQQSMLPVARAESSVWGDLTRAVARRDGVFAHPAGEAPSQWAGWGPEHAFELWPATASIVPGTLLLLRGRIYWPDSSVTFALSQHGRSWMTPRLELVAADGKTTAPSESFGFPCGMDRLLALPLVAPGAGGPWRSVRLVTEHCFLWDEAHFVPDAVAVELAAAGERTISLGARPARVRLEELPLLRAELGFRGISRVVGDLERHEQTYDFDDTTAALTFQSPGGQATRYGDVRELLLQPDSRLVVMPPGDALYCEFGAGDAGSGTATTYFLQVTGWAKESNFHNTTGRSIEPLPFHGMAGYPPPTAGPAAPTTLGRPVGDR